MQFYEYHEAIFSSKLSSKAKLVGLAIAYYYNWKEASASFPSIQLLEKRTSLSRATIHRAKQELIEAGYLKQTRRYDSSNRYLPVIPPMSQDEMTLVSQGRTNNEYNNEINNELKESKDSFYMINNNMNQEEVWKVFENEERTKLSVDLGRSNRIPGKGNHNLGRNYKNRPAITGFAAGPNPAEERGNRMGGN